MYYFVGSVEAKSPCANASLTYSLAGGANKARFFIDANTGFQEVPGATYTGIF